MGSGWVADNACKWDIRAAFVLFGEISTSCQYDQHNSLQWNVVLKLVSIEQSKQSARYETYWFRKINFKSANFSFNFDVLHCLPTHSSYLYVAKVAVALPGP